MADIKKVNVGGLDYNVKDDTARTNASTALTELAYKETGNTASQAYATIGTPINWKGTLYYTKTAVAKGATWAVNTNLTAATNLGKLTSNIKTYVNSSGQLVFRDLRGADTVLPFKGTSEVLVLVNEGGQGSISYIKDKNASISIPNYNIIPSITNDIINIPANQSSTTATVLKKCVCYSMPRGGSQTTTNYNVGDTIAMTSSTRITYVFIPN